MVRCSAVLMWRLAIKGLVTTTLGMQAKYDVEWDSRICRMQKWKYFARPKRQMICLTRMYDKFDYYLRQGDHVGLSVILSVCLSVCLSVYVQPHAKRYTLYLHDFLPNVSLGPVSRWFHFGVDPGWPSVLFRGHSRPARSFRHKIYCNSAETVRYTTKVTIEH